MRVKEAKDKLCPLSFSDVSGKSTCQARGCMWWIDQGIDNEGNCHGRCVITAILQALYDLGKEN